MSLNHYKYKMDKKYHNIHLFENCYERNKNSYKCNLKCGGFFSFLDQAPFYSDIILSPSVECDVFLLRM